jgi:hypothetical protein
MNNGLAKRPVGTAAAVPVGVLAAVACVTCGVVGVRDSLQAAGAVSGPSWTGWLAGKLETVQPGDWMIPAGVIAIVAGLLFLVAAVKPRRVTHVAVGQDGVWIRRRESAEAVDSVISATAKSRRRTVRITVRATGDTDRVATDLDTTVGQRLAVLSPPPRIRRRVVEEH